MGRIEDALEKLQQSRLRSGAAPARSPTRLASVVAHEQHYGGKSIHFDTAQLRANGLLAPDSDERRLAEQYRIIKRPLLRNAEPDREPAVSRGNLLMVASALAAEGKTFTCVNLCLSIAREKDWSVVLVDGDSVKPHLTRLFSAEGEPGLIDLLRGTGLTFDSVVMKTDVPGLSLLPAGSRDPHAAELLASRRMDELCNELARAQDRIIIFDSSPLLLTSEAVIIASQVGQIALVVRANSTPRQAVLAAMEKLDADKPVACILNRTYGVDGLEYGQYSGYGEQAE
jgi:protein-tyrosine kinase